MYVNFAYILTAEATCRGSKKVYGKWFAWKATYLSSNIVSQDHLPTYSSSFDSRGFFEWNVTVARKHVTGKIYPEDLVKFAAVDTSLVWDHTPYNLHVLTVHGLNDRQVPP